MNSELKTNSLTKGETVMSTTKETGAIVLQDGKTISINDYINRSEKPVRHDVYLGKITNIDNLEKGRYFITPCWAKASGDDNKVAYLTCNKKLAVEDIVLGMAVVFSVVEERKHPGKFMALGVAKYEDGMEVITERPENFATNISKSRQAYLDKGCTDKEDVANEVESDDDLIFKLCKTIDPELTQEKYESIDKEEPEDQPVSKGYVDPVMAIIEKQRKGVK